MIPLGLSLLETCGDLVFNQYRDTFGVPDKESQNIRLAPFCIQLG